MAGNQRNAYGHRDHRNLIPNGGMDVWGRGTDFVAAAANIEVASGWEYKKGGAVVHTVSQEITGSTYYIQLDVTTADASLATSDNANLSISLPGRTLRGLNMGTSDARTVTISFDHAHTKTGTYCVALRNTSLAGTRRSYVAEYTQAVADAWERSTITLTLDTTGTWTTDDDTGILLSWVFSCGTAYQKAPGSWGDGNYIATSNQVNSSDNVANFQRLTRIKMEVGEFATEFETQGSSYAEERAIASDYIITPRPNFVINGAFDLWQRGTSFTNLTGYAADRWRCSLGAADISQVSGDYPGKTGGFVLKAAQDVASTHCLIDYRIEAADARKLWAQPVTVSFWAKGDASATTGLECQLQHATAADNFASLTNIKSVTVADPPTTTWTFYQAFFTPSDMDVAGVTNGVQLRIYRGNTYAGAQDMYLKNVKLEIGDFATDFVTAGRNIAEELAMAQRYFYMVSTGQALGVATGMSATTMRCQNDHPVEMRKNPTITATGKYRVDIAVTKYVSYANYYSLSPRGGQLVFDTPVGFTPAANTSYLVDAGFNNGSGTNEIEFDAEL